jgi:CelD/BcsL family acetyltransferase involved in cellulose biosynthesis
VRRDNLLLAVFPLALHSPSVLETPGYWLSDYLDPLVDSAAAEQCWTLILDLLNDLWDWSTRALVFHNIAQNSPTRTILETIAPKYGFAYEQNVTDCVPYLSLPDSWEKYLQMLSSKERQIQKKNIRKAQTEGEARWLTAKTMDEVGPALERGLVGLTQAKGEKGKFASEFLCGFLRKMVPALVAQGDFYMHELWIQGKAAAWLFLFRSREGPMFFNSAFDDSLGQWRPGITAISLAVQTAIEQKYPKFDFLRGAEEYKFRFGCQPMDLLKISLIRKTSELARDTGIFRRR